MNTQIQTLLDKDVTRKEFFTLVGSGIVAALGLGSLTKLLLGRETTPPNPTSGYGARGFGQ